LSGRNTRPIRLIAPDNRVAPDYCVTPDDRIAPDNRIAPNDGVSPDSLRQRVTVTPNDRVWPNGTSSRILTVAPNNRVASHCIRNCVAPDDRVAPNNRLALDGGIAPDNGVWTNLITPDDRVCLRAVVGPNDCVCAAFVFVAPNDRRIRSPTVAPNDRVISEEVAPDNRVSKCDVTSFGDLSANRDAARCCAQIPRARHLRRQRDVQASCPLLNQTETLQWLSGVLKSELDLRWSQPRFLLE
jgi:hypothetical protein